MIKQKNSNFKTVGRENPASVTRVRSQMLKKLINWQNYLVINLAAYRTAKKFLRKSI